MWRDRGNVGLMGGLIGGRPPNFSVGSLGTAVAIARCEALILSGIAKTAADVHLADLPC